MKNLQYDIFDALNANHTDKFLEYHTKYPSVFQKFKQLAIDAKNLGHKHFSARGLFQVMRFKMGGDLKQDGYKYNNNYTPFYVRLLEKECPEFVGFFEKRKSNSDQLIKAEV